MATKVSIAIRYATAINTLVDLYNSLARKYGREEFIPYMGGDESRRAIMLENLAIGLAEFSKIQEENSSSVIIDVKLEK